MLAGLGCDGHVAMDQADALGLFDVLWLSNSTSTPDQDGTMPIVGLLLRARDVLGAAITLIPAHPTETSM